MKPERIGRVLGTGLRVAGRIAGEQLAASARQKAAQASAPQPVAHPVQRVHATAQATGQTARAAARGVGGFLKPFRRVGGILWLEVTGVFFLLPVVVFAPNLWRMRSSAVQGPDHRTFLVTAVVVAVFLYLGLSSFWRAHKRSSRG